MNLTRKFSLMFEVIGEITGVETIA
jgi:hypothetical protein